MSLFYRLAFSLSLLLGANVAFADSYADPPGRVARLAYTRGEVSFSPAGENDWVIATLNRPLIRGDRLWTDRDARAELQLGSAAVRLDEGTSLQLLNLDDRAAQVELTQGTLNLRVRRLYQGQSFEVDTPTLAFEITRPGQYRIDVDDQGQHTTVAVWDGGGTAYGEHANFPIREGEAIRFYDTDLRDYQVYDIPRPDDFDRFCQSRDDRYERSVSRRYVSEDMVGYADLDEYGSWSEVREYGSVWYPTRVSAGWAPYRDGRWIWQEPWGWTWVDSSPWGFAPFHYGRWAYIDSRWGWIPGPVSVRPVYAPALVAFVGGRNWSVGVNLGGGAPIGWFPLGPREVYCPTYRVSRNYFTSINVSNTVINNTYITNVYNDYSAGRALTNVNYAYRGNPGALTAVSSTTFVNAQPVSQGMLRMDRDAASRAEVMRVAALAPVQRSVVGGAAAASNVPQRAVVERNVVARSAPPPSIVPFAQREQALRRDPGRPLEPSVAETMTQPRAMRGGGNERAGAPTNERVRVVGNGEGAVNTRALAPNADRGGPRDMGGRGNSDRAVSERGGPSRDAGDRGGRETLERGRGNDPVLRSGEEGRARGPRVDAERADVNERARAPAENRDVGNRPPTRNEGLPSRNFRSGDSAGRDAAQERAGRDRAEQAESRSEMPTRRVSPETQQRDESPQREERPQREQRSMRSGQEDQAQRVEPQTRRFEQPQREERAQRVERREEPVRRVEPQQRDEQPQRNEREQPRFEAPQRRAEPQPQQQQQREEAPSRGLYAPRQEQAAQQPAQQQAQPQRQQRPERQERQEQPQRERKGKRDKNDDDGGN